KLIVKPDDSIYTKAAVTMIVFVVIMVVIMTICSNVQTGTNIPLKTRRSGDRTMNFVQACQSKTIMPEICDPFAGISIIKEMLQRNTDTIPNFQPKGRHIRTAVCTPALSLHHIYS